MTSTAKGPQVRRMSSADLGIIHDKIPWRFCFVGGWMDLKWVNEHWNGCIVTINIKFHAGICKDECGLATSSRKVLAKIWDGKPPTHLTAMEAAQCLWGAENFHAAATEERTYYAGSQDHIGLFFPGINKLCYSGGRHWPYEVVSLNDPSDPKQKAIFDWLERVVHIVDIPFVSRPEGYSSQEVNYLKDPNVPNATKAAMVKALAEASEAAWQAIIAMDADKLGKALSDTMEAWQVALPYTVNPYLGKDESKGKQLAEFVAKYDRPHTKGCLFSGAGGGFLMVISEAPVAGAMQMKLNHDHIVKPYDSDTLAYATQHNSCSAPPPKPPWGEWSPWQFDLEGKPLNKPVSPYGKYYVAGAVAAALAAGVLLGRKM